MVAAFQRFEIREDHKSKMSVILSNKKKKKSKVVDLAVLHSGTLKGVGSSGKRGGAEFFR